MYACQLQSKIGAAVAVRIAVYKGVSILDFKAKLACLCRKIGTANELGTLVDPGCRRFCIS
jgi:hypothetical protein